MTAREPSARPTPAQVAADLGQILAGGAATTVLAAAPQVERTTALPRTRVAEAYTAPPVRQPAVVPAPRRRSAMPYVLTLLLLVAVIAAGAYALSTRQAPLVELPQVSEQLPDQLRTDLQRLRDATEQLEVGS